MINVLIADDQNFVRKTLESYLKPELDLNVIGFAENGEVAIAQVTKLKPDVVLMDIEMPVMDGFAATKAIVQQFADTKVLILSIHDRKQDIADALELGAKGYLLKNTTAQELTDAIRHVHKGYFQLALELVEKHLGKATITSSPLKQDYDLNHKLEVVDSVLAKIEQKVSTFERSTLQNLNETVENIVKQEMHLRRERDANLQFKLDRLRHKINQFEKNTGLAIKVQLMVNLFLIFTVCTLSYFVFIE